MLATCLPFELRDALVATRYFGVTDVEAVLYLSLGLWALASRGRPRVWSRVHPAALLWAAALAISAACARDHQGAAVKFALRELGGVLLFFATADLVAVRGRAFVLGVAYCTGACASALSALAELASPAAAAALLPFKTQPSLLDGLLRASGTFQYANLGAMYWAMALPVLVGVAALLRPGLAELTVVAGSLLLAEALVLSASRAGLLAALVALAVLYGAARSCSARLRRPALLALACLLLLVASGFVQQRGLALRLRPREDRAWFDAEFALGAPVELRAGAAGTVRLRARNTGRLRWWAGGTHGMALAYSWLDESGSSVHVAAPLLRNVDPGETAVLDLPVVAPPSPGSHWLRWMLVADSVVWVSPRAAPGVTDVELAVVGSSPGAPLESDAAPAGPSLLAQRQPTRPELWRAGLALWRERPFVGVGPDNFRRLYAAKLGPRPLDERVHADSLYVEVLATLGLLGLAALLAVAVALARAGAGSLGSCDPAVGRGDPWQAGGAILLGSLSGLFAFFVHGALDYGLAATPIYGAFWLLAGIVAGLSATAGGTANTAA